MSVLHLKCIQWRDMMSSQLVGLGSVKRWLLGCLSQPILCHSAWFCPVLLLSRLLFLASSLVQQCIAGTGEGGGAGEVGTMPSAGLLACIRLKATNADGLSLCCYCIGSHVVPPACGGEWEWGKSQLSLIFTVCHCHLRSVVTATRTCLGNDIFLFP